MEPAEFTPDALPDLLPLYYKRLFPYGPFYRWISYGNGMYFLKLNVYCSSFGAFIETYSLKNLKPVELVRLLLKDFVVPFFTVVPNYFQNREFSFTLAEDIYIRFKSFLNQDDMEREIQKRCPYKIDIGAVYATR